MSWWKLDDGFWSHPKVARLFDGPCPGDAIALFCLSGSWCSKELTDGDVPAGFVKRQGLHKKAADELVRVGLFERHADGFVMHDYLDYNPTREKVLEERAKGAARAGRSYAKKPRTFAGSSGEDEPKSPRTFAGSSDAPDPVPDPVSPEDSSPPPTPTPSSARAREVRVPEHIRGFEASLSAEEFSGREVAAIFSELRSACKRGSFRLVTAPDRDRAEEVAAMARADSSGDPAAWVRTGVTNFLAHADGRAADGWPFWGYANDPGKWFSYDRTSAAMPARGPAPAASASDFARSAGRTF